MKQMKKIVIRNDYIYYIKYIYDDKIIMYVIINHH